MLGNDVVDLGEPETRAGAQHPGFDERVFGPRERRALRHARRPERLRWRLWAAKEAAYKAARRLDASVVFSPRRFEVTAGERARATVRCGARAFAVRIEEEVDFVHAIATALDSEARGEAGEAARAGEALASFGGWGAGAFGVGTLDAFAAPAHRATGDGARAEDPRAPGRAARALALRGVAGHLGIDPAELSIARVDRMPALRRRGAPLPAVLSLSHHGRFAAWAVASAPGAIR